MNCGHAICCADCKPKVKDTCPICGVKVSYMIQASKGTSVQKFVRQPSSVEDLDKVSNVVKEEPEDDESDISQPRTQNYGVDSSSYFPSRYSPRKHDHANKDSIAPSQDQVPVGGQSNSGSLSSSHVSRVSAGSRAPGPPEGSEEDQPGLLKKSSEMKANQGMSRFFKPDADSKSGISEIKPEQSELSLPRAVIDHNKAGAATPPGSRQLESNPAKRGSDSQTRLSAVFGKSRHKPGASESEALLIEPEAESQKNSRLSLASRDPEPRQLQKISESGTPQSQKFSQNMRDQDGSEDAPLKGNTRGVRSHMIPEPPQHKHSAGVSLEQQNQMRKSALLGNRRDIFEAQDSQEHSPEQSGEEEQDDDEESQMPEFRLTRDRLPGAGDDPAENPQANGGTHESNDFSSQSDLSAEVIASTQVPPRQGGRTGVPGTSGLNFPARIGRN